jgi:hypothetical protein
MFTDSYTQLCSIAYGCVEWIRAGSYYRENTIISNDQIIGVYLSMKEQCCFFCWL